VRSATTLGRAPATPDTLPGMRSSDAIAPRRRPSPWAWLVTGSAVVVLGCGLVLGVWWLATSERQIATYSVTGAVNRVTLDGQDVTSAIRTPEMSDGASRVSALPEVRAALLGLQRRIGAAGGVVVEGRDIGTVVFPDAEAKFFLTANTDERARRRVAELTAAGKPVDTEQTKAEIIARDTRDSTRAAAPLRKADDAIEIDSSTLPPDAVVAKMADVVAQRSRG